MKLTDEQARIMAVCAMCQAQLDHEQVKPMLEAGRTLPAEMMCPKCGQTDEEHIAGLYRMWAMIAAQKMVQRIERAGLMKHYEKVAADELTGRALRRQNRQN